MSQEPMSRRQMESELLRKTEQLESYCHALRQLHALQLRPHRSYQEFCLDYLEVGRKLFGMGTGLVSRVEGDRYHIESILTSSPDVWTAREVPLADMLCARVVATKKAQVSHDLSALPEGKAHPAYRILHMRCFMSAPIHLHERICGTLHFSNTEPRAEPFEEYEVEILDLMAGGVSHFLALRQAASDQIRMRREQAEREHQHEAMLDRSERLATLGLLATGVAHEINNPLQGMQSHLSAVRRALPPDFPRVESLEMVEKGMSTIASIVRQLLALQAPGAQEMQRCSLPESVRFVATLLKPEFRKSKVKIENRVEPLSLPVAFSQAHLSQVLLNLLINARDAMSPEGGEVSIEAEQNSTETHLWVSDTGKGFDPERAEAIFAPFFTTKGAHGTGLGLTVAESLIRNAKGRIYATSVPGQGSVFHLHLPNARA